MRVSMGIPTLPPECIRSDRFQFGRFRNPEVVSDHIPVQLISRKRLAPSLPDLQRLQIMLFDQPRQRCGSFVRCPLLSNPRATPVTNPRFAITDDLPQDLPLHWPVQPPNPRKSLWVQSAEPPVGPKIVRFVTRAACE